MNKTIEFNDVLEQIANGVDKLVCAVGSTLGPSGKNVLIANKKGSPLITKDGVTVARNITLSDPLEDIGAQMVKEVAFNANRVGGDGTTTATVLAGAILAEGIKLIHDGCNPIDLKREIDKCVESTVKELKDVSRTIENEGQILDVAKISTNNDTALAELIAKCVNHVGTIGTVSVEDSENTTSYCKFIEGMQVERGLISQFFVTDIARQRASYENAKLLICNYPLDNLRDLSPILERCKNEKFPLIILAESYEDNLLAALVANRMQLGLKIVCLHTPGTGDYKKEYIEDLAQTVGAIVLEADYGTKLHSITDAELGHADKVISTYYDTTVIGGKGDNARADIIKAQLEYCEDTHLKNCLKDRYARLTSNIALLKLGSVSQTEMKDKKLRVEDAINATRAALDEGIVPGGGLILYRLADRVDSDLKGGRVLKKAMVEPLKLILENAGEADNIMPDKFTHGYDARARVYDDMYEMGIVDPTKVVRSALENAASVAGMILTTHCCIIPEETDE